ncbi:hypothetical protein JI739_22580 [Ramlibacter sp. AW1]|uniref:N-acetyltransferase domain-containing protein n=1 Tax=Ramlibacter aurantiacus TaxID=2801330 RepID=A0A937D3W6_9BURK|nr:GNAT family N-acetyltransferase [Ramlibacter aurantiacus]MBL0423139.1 hypothetical protein [Ramlibacter aurantiacus]
MPHQLQPLLCFRTSRPDSKVAWTIDISPIEPDSLVEAAQASMRCHRFNAAARGFSVRELEHWSTLPDHHALCVRVTNGRTDHGVVGLLVCHADEEDFIADAFMLEEAFLGLGIEFEMVDVLARLAFASGCGAVVLHLTHSDNNHLVRAFYAGLGQAMETLSSGDEEVAFASLAVDDVLAAAKRTWRNSALTTSHGLDARMPVAPPPLYAIVYTPAASLHRDNAAGR